MQENRNVVIRCFTVALFILMLFSIRLFVYPEMWTHVVAITTALLLFVAGMWKGISVKEIPVSLSLFLCWGIYIAVYTIWQGSEMYSVTFLLSSCLLYYSTYRLSCGEVLSLPFARRVVIACAVIEAVVCLLQWGGFLPGTSLYFSVTGTFENPNITAMILALAFPCAVGEIGSGRKTDRLWYFIMVILLFAVWLLRCRTAYLCIVFSLLVLHNSLPFLRWVFHFRKKVVWAVLLVLLPLSGYLMYHMKKDSADGRLFIWKVSISLFSERPLKGFGYGRFGAVYNPYQEEYVEKYPLSVTEVQNIRSVNMPYNEFLEQCIGGGLVGGIFFMSIPAYFIALAYRRKRWVELAISGNILIMCSFNFVTQAIPVWFMYVFLMGAQMVQERKSTAKNYAITVSILAFVCFLFCSVSISSKAVAQYHLRKALVLYPENPESALSALTRYKKMASTSECYLRYYGKMLLDAGHYDEALPILQEAAHYTSLPDLRKDIVKVKSRLLF